MKRFALVAMLIAFIACDKGGGSVPDIPAAQSIEVTSSAFADGERIPKEYTCDGEDVSPPLTWRPGPGATHYAIAVTDPDAPGGTFLHWLVYGIPAGTTKIGRGGLPEGAIQLANDFGNVGYGGPCPPAGKPHRYVFTVYAIDRPAEQVDVDARAWLESIQGDVSATGELTGTYGR